jgi:cysteine desulfurase/selenocysteine lyase
MLTADARQHDFPALAEQAYLNTAAEGLPPPAVLRAVEDYLRDKQDGMRGRDAHFSKLEACRAAAAAAIGMRPDEVAFCSCSSEAYNLLASGLSLTATDEVVFSDLDFPAGVTPWLSGSTACSPRLWQARSGRLEVADLERLLTRQTRLVQVSLISFWNGHHVPWDATLDAVRRRAPHKWALGLHGGCIVGVRDAVADRATPRAGGWHHLENAFAADRFSRAVIRQGAAGYAVGMPNFAAIYALEAALRYLQDVGVEAIATHADPLVAKAAAGLESLGIDLLCPLEAVLPGGILAFQHSDSDRLAVGLERDAIHVMHHAGRIRIAIHGYNTKADIDQLLSAVRRWRDGSAGRADD